MHVSVDLDARPFRLKREVDSGEDRAMDRDVELNRAPSDCFSLAMGSSIDSSSQLNSLQNL